MKFSIVVVAYRRYERIPCLMHSLLAQTYSDYEVIVIHDGHDDRHTEAMKPFIDNPKVTYFQTPIRYNDWGHSLRNIGLTMVKGDFVINTNDDNYYVPVWLDELNKAISSQEDCNFVYYQMVSNHNNSKHHNQKSYGVLIPRIELNWIDMGQFTVKRDVIQKYQFLKVNEADGHLIESMKHELKPVYIDKVLFVHN